MFYGLPQFSAHSLSILNVMSILTWLSISDAGDVLDVHFTDNRCRSEAFAVAFEMRGRFDTQGRTL
jgi:hypothetical protein